MSALDIGLLGAVGLLVSSVRFIGRHHSNSSCRVNDTIASAPCVQFDWVGTGLEIALLPLNPKAGEANVTVAVDLDAGTDMRYAVFTSPIPDASPDARREVANFVFPGGRRNYSMWSGTNLDGVSSLVLMKNVAKYPYRHKPNFTA